MSKLQQIIGSIKDLNVLELSELVGKLQEEFGISSADLSGSAPVSAQSSAAGSAKKEEEKSSFKVELVDIGADKMKVIKALRQVKKELGLIEAKNATESLPYLIFADSKKDDAESAEKLLAEAGAKVKLS
jgi:large subunit ribosomal protein L7/L12